MVGDEALGVGAAAARVNAVPAKHIDCRNGTAKTLIMPFMQIKVIAVRQQCSACAMNMGHCVLKADP